jgi:hypothetical protein
MVLADQKVEATMSKQTDALYLEALKRRLGELLNEVDCLTAERDAAQTRAAAWKRAATRWRLLARTMPDVQQVAEQDAWLARLNGPPDAPSCPVCGQRAQDTGAETLGFRHYVCPEHGEFTQESPFPLTEG